MPAGAVGEARARAAPRGGTAQSTRLRRAGFRIIAIGASAGGVAAVSRLLATLPRDLDAALLVIIHRGRDGDNLAAVLGRSTAFEVRAAGEGDRLDPGVCLVAPAGPVLWVGTDLRVHLLRDGFYRAHSIDASLSSLAVNAGRRAIGIVMSGALSDGAMGLRAIKDAGGEVFVQSPGDAEFRDMPQNAITQAGLVDFEGTAEELGSAVRRAAEAGQSFLIR